ncbi:helix-turn-helix domain protein [Paraburkholderia xenovorans LB400]|uniref:Transcriptional regulator, AraC family n=2 Tax=Paraburkholderia xenovorans TaxID=36873 RepID=Q13JD5_PARXL|nr:transcriptional regulator, AraC family [Paraburkholderia xenovorans LB400]AIP37908.1 helix-turn-helix domain protein [Paraburkholderia xenovorans LB400]
MDRQKTSQTVPAGDADDGDDTSVDEKRSPLILTEQVWRKRPAYSSPLPDDKSITLSRWTIPEQPTPVEFRSDGNEDSHIITYSLRQSSVDFWMEGQRVSNGRVTPHAVLMTGPGQPGRAVFYKVFDSIRMYLPQALLAECHEGAYGRPPNQDIVLSHPHFVADQKVRHLVEALVLVDQTDGAMGRIYVDSIGLAIGARLIALHGERRNPVDRSQGLSAWRLRHVIEYIDAHLSSPIGLAELANVAGLSRMHFARRFREVTGQTPHQYVLRCRIMRAQQLLCSPALSVTDIASALAFKTTAHFSTVFRHIVGESPTQWRKRLR